jgi:hypothetical protein
LSSANVFFFFLEGVFFWVVFVFGFGFCVFVDGLGFGLCFFFGGDPPGVGGSRAAAASAAAIKARLAAKVAGDGGLGMGSIMLSIIARCKSTAASLASLLATASATDATAASAASIPAINAKSRRTAVRLPPGPVFDMPT